MRSIIRLRSWRESMRSSLPMAWWISNWILMRIVFLIRTSPLLIIHFDQLRHHYLTMLLKHSYLSLWATTIRCSILSIFMSARFVSKWWLVWMDAIMSSWCTRVAEFIFYCGPISSCWMFDIWLAFSEGAVVDVSFYMLAACEPSSPCLELFLLTIDLIFIFFCHFCRILLICIIIDWPFQWSWNILHMSLEWEIISIR